MAVGVLKNSHDRSRNSRSGKATLVPCKGGLPKMVLSLKAGSRTVLDCQGSPFGVLVLSAKTVAWARKRRSRVSVAVQL